MSYTVNQLIIDTERHLRSFHRERRNILNGAITDSATSLLLTYRDPTIQPGHMIEIDTEIMYVHGVQNLTLTVERAMDGSTAAAHSSGAGVRIQPAFPRAAIMAALLAEIRSWPRGLYKTTTVDLTWPAASNMVDLDGTLNLDVHGILDAIRRPTGSSTSTDTDPWMRVPLRLRRNLSTALYTSGNGVALASGTSYGTAHTIRVTYASGFILSTFTTSTDVETTCGLTSSMLDIAPLGAAARLLGNAEAVRATLDVQGQARNAAEVPPGYAQQAADGYRKLADRRISEERTRLLGLYPYAAWS